MSTPEVTGQDRQQTPASDYNAIRFLVTQLLNAVVTFDVVKVVKVTNSGELAPVGFVDVQPQVNQLTGDGQSVPHGIIYNLPYLRIQGGSNAVILDPKPGDLGVCGFCRRDISSVKSARGQANPGSFRTFNWADGIYLYSVLGAVPDQFVRFSDDGIELVSTSKVRLQAPLVEIVGELQQTDGDASFAQNVDVGDSVTAATEVTAGNIGLTTHKHPTAGTGPPSAPIP